MNHSAQDKKKLQYQITFREEFEVELIFGVRFYFLFNCSAVISKTSDVLTTKIRNTCLEFGAESLLLVLNVIFA